MGFSVKEIVQGFKVQRAATHNSPQKLILQPVALRHFEKDRADNHRAQRDDEAESGQLADMAVIP
jgi:hypothetical protein